MTPAVLKTAPSRARLPLSTARPPSLVWACGTERTTPFSPSVSSSSQVLVVENAWVVRTPPGAAWKRASAFFVAVPPRMSHSASQLARSGEWTVWMSWSSSPARSSSPRIAGMPPARWTSSTCAVPLGATFDRVGTRREMRSMSSRPKSTSPSIATARMCRIVLVEPPIATSIAMALWNAARVAIERGSTDSSPSS